MSSGETLLLAIAAVLVFWAVGAYNRLVRLRHEIARACAPLEAQVRQRDAALRAWVGALRPVLEGADTPADAVLAAADQVLVALDRLRLRPTSARAAASLRLADDTLSAARERLLAELPSHLHSPRLSGASLEVAGPAEELAAAASALGFSRAQFNATVDQYNEAVLQFPTVLIASLFGFRAAGPL
ncbi:LemA family protein [Piscinibacter sakaiensis]|uniref:LemA protein n=1 Tax=Piscinibacter sakaiensis TaxID=1547922 RepID=A0A0K8NYP7_PISS1|nr:LemA family protein [Piscinibacter sakaiensis]GAP35424.1 LemA protein [Piscinibacter sakaiensis]